tara:strand:+ start:2712 stop:2906 length:195 start_codon:yes stop_codon:yes gene_type:complete
MAVEIYSLPYTSEELIEHLDEKYPNRSIQPSMTLEQAHREAGNREVVDYLITLRDSKDEDLLET